MELIESVFASDPLIGPDPFLSESRFRAVGQTREGRRAFVVFTVRRSTDGLLLRPISARYMHVKEVQAYERSKQT